MEESQEKSELAHKQCIACEGGVEPLKGEALEKLLKQLGNDWEVIDEHHLEKQYKFKDFSKGHWSL
jgi:4a-hydroxytetrahydrobiopterin dehydratase